MLINAENSTYELEENCIRNSVRLIISNYAMILKSIEKLAQEFAASEAQVRAPSPTQPIVKLLHYTSTGYENSCCRRLPNLDPENLDTIER